jgi:putative sterol carrier protein
MSFVSTVDSDLEQNSMSETKLVDAENTIKCVLDRLASKSAIISDYTKVIQFEFTDAKVAYRIKIVNGKVENVEKFGSRQDADVSVTCKVEVLQDIIDNKLGAMRALITRKVTVHGPVMAIRELRQKVLGPEHNATG